MDTLQHTMDFRLIFDALIATLLVATIAYAAVLNRKLGALRDAKSEMEALLVSFTDSAERAGSGVESLKREAGRSGKALQGRLDAARGLVDDLGFLIERGTKLAERLDSGAGAGRAKPAPEPVPQPRARAEPLATVAAKAETGAAQAKTAMAEMAGSGGGTAADLSAAETDLLKALQGMR